MPKYKLKDGSIVDAPDDLTAEESAWLKAQGGVATTPVNPAVDFGKNLLGGVVEGAIRAPLIGADLGHLAKVVGHKIFPDTVSPAEPTSYSDDLLNILRDDAGLKLPTPETRAGRYGNSIGNGVGGLVLGGTGALRGPVSLAARDTMGQAMRSVVPRLAASPVTQAGAVGAAGEFAGDASRGFDENESQNPLARLAGSAGAAIMAAIKGRVARPAAARPLHETFSGTTPGQFDQAQAETARLAAAGATQNTVGDSMYGVNPAAGALEREVSNELGAGALNAKLAGRVTGDLPNLENQARDAINQAVVPNPGVRNARNPTEQADLLAQAIKARSDTRQGILQSSGLVPRGQVASVIRALRARQLDPENRGTVDAVASAAGARAVGATPMYPMGPAPVAPIPPRASGPTPVTPIVGPQGPGPAMTGNPGIPGPSPVALPAPAGNALVPQAPVGGALGPRILDPNDFGMGPKPMSGFRMPSEPDITTIEQLPPRVPTGANLVALSKIVKGLDSVTPKMQGPAAGVLNTNAVSGAAGAASRQLRAVNPIYDAAMTAHADMSPGVEALRVLEATPGVLAGNPSTQVNKVREALATHLAGIDQANGGNLAATVAEKLHAGDVMAANTAQHGLQGLRNEVGQTALGAVVSPGNAALRALSTSSQRKAMSDISALMANPTPETYRILRELAARDPDLARRYIQYGLGGSTNAATQTEGSAP